MDARQKWIAAAEKDKDDDDEEEMEEQRLQKEKRWSYKANYRRLNELQQQHKTR